MGVLIARSGVFAVAQSASPSLPELPVAPSAQSPAASVSTPPPLTSGPVIRLQDALRLARANSPQFQTAVVNAEIAHEKRLQARDARLPSVNALNQFIYTEGNGTPSGVFIANDGVHVYNEQAVVRQDLFALLRNGQSLQARAAEAVAVAEEEIARRGLVQTVVQDFYNLVTAQRKIQTARTSLRDASDFVTVTEKQEQAGIVSHVDVVKAQIEAEQRTRDLENMQLAADQAHLALAVLLFPGFNQSFTVEDSADALPPLPTLSDTQRSAMQDNPDLRSARASVTQAHSAATVARYAYLPSFALTFYYGIDANQLTDVSPLAYGATKITLPNNLVNDRQNLGYAADATLDIPLWNWGATRSKVREAESSLHLAEINASFAERQLQANIRSLYQQAEVAHNQLVSLAHSRDLAEENLHLTLLRYQAGEATALEAVSAESSLALARDAYEDGRNHYYTALAQLQTLTGSL